MRLTTLRWLAGPLAGLALMAGAPALAQTTPEVRVGSFSGAYLAARLAESDNDLDSAIAYYRRALDYDRSNRTVRQSLLLGLVSRGQFDEALEHAEALKDVPEVERFSRLALAVDAMRDGEYEAAEELLDLSRQSELDRLITGVVKAWAILGGGDVERALEQVDSLSGPEWYNLFLSYHGALIADVGGDAEEAATRYGASVANLTAGGAAPETMIRAMEANAAFLARQGDDEAALAALDDAEEFFSGRVTVEALREAIEAGEEVAPLVADARAGASELLLNLSTALNRGGGDAFVRLYLHYALALKPDSDAVLVQLAGIAEQQDRPQDAIDFYSRIGIDSPLKNLSELQLGLNLADLDRHEEAIEHLTALLEANPDDMRAYLALGGVYHSQENYAAGAELYDRAAARIDEPERAHWNIYYQRGIAYERLKEWEKAEPNFKQALELFPDHPHVLNYLGYSWVDMSINLDEGLELIKRAVELRPSDGYIVDSLGWAYYRLERFDDAVRELERAVNLMPNDPILNDHLGDAYWRVGRRLEATFQWSHARDMEPEPDLLAEIETKLADGLAPVDDAPATVVADASGTRTANDADEEQAAQNEPSEAPEEIVAAAAPTGEEAVEFYHIVSRGQTLWGIAVERYGNGERYRQFFELNPGLRGNPNLIHPGQRIILPGASE